MNQWLEIGGVGTILNRVEQKSLSDRRTLETSPGQHQGMSHEKSQILGRVNIK